jgi:endonuclease/exonuclease/phosphatase family metal-dependent hydrolase
VDEDRLPARHRPHDPVALHATIDHPAGQLHVIVSCVEWEPAYADDHLAQTRALAQLVSAPALDGPLPVLLTADLNAPPHAIEVAALTAVMTDTWVAAGGAPDAVTLSSDNPYAPLEAERQIDRRIDYVLARPGAADRGVTATQAFTVHGPIDGVHPSDHAPVAVDLQLRPPEAESHRTVKEIP